jgi:hypothetical protein
VQKIYAGKGIRNYEFCSVHKENIVKRNLETLMKSKNEWNGIDEYGLSAFRAGLMLAASSIPKR